MPPADISPARCAELGIAVAPVQLQQFSTYAWIGNRPVCTGKMLHQALMASRLLVAAVAAAA